MRPTRRLEAPRWAGLAALFLALPLLGSCYNWRSTVVEFDSVLGYVEAEEKEPEELRWRNQALRFPWPLRWFEGELLAGVAESVVDRGWISVRSPGAFAKDRIRWLAELAETDLLKIGESCWRLLLVLDRDPDELNRIYAAQGLSLLMQTFAEDDAREVELQVVGNDHAGFVTGDIGEYRIAARKLVQSFEGSWPGRREDPLLTGGGREDFARAVDALARLHTGALRQERLRLRLLLEAVRVEPFAPLRERLAGSLVYAVQVACVRGLHTALLDAAGSVRLAAMEELIRLGGRELLPRILAELEQRAEVLATEGRSADPDPEMRRALAHYYWSAGPELAERRYDEGRNGFEFLHELASSDPESSLRILGADALAWILRREADPFGEWIPEWWQGYLEQKRSGEPDTTNRSGS